MQKEEKKILNNKIRVQNGSICYETRTSPHLIFKYRPIKNTETNLLTAASIQGTNCSVP